MSRSALAVAENFEPHELRERVRELKDTVEQSYAEMARHLWKIHEQKLYQAWGYETFDEYVERDLEYGLRKALFFVAIAELAMKTGKPHLFDKIGWTKARVIAQSRPDPREAERLVELAMRKSRAELEEHVRKPSGGSSFAPLHTVSLKLTDEQKEIFDAALSTARKMMPQANASSFRDSLVLTYALQAFLAGQTFEKDGRKNLQHQFKKFEKLLRVKLIAMDPDEKGKDKLVYVSPGAADDIRAVLASAT